MGNCPPEKTNVNQGEANLTLVFEGLQFPMLPYRAVSNYYIIHVLNVNYWYTEC